MRPERILTMVFRRLMNLGLRKLSAKLDQTPAKPGEKLSPGSATRKMRRIGRPF